MPTTRAGMRLRNGHRRISLRSNGSEGCCRLLSTRLITRSCRNSCKRCVRRVGNSRRRCTARRWGGDSPLQERGGQDVGRGNGILDGEIDPDAADRRHGVGGIADAQQPRSIPPTQAIDANGQELDIAPLAEFGDAVARKGDERCDLVAQGRQPLLRISSAAPFGMTYAHCQ
jgi:hypothetical protein